VGPDPCDGHALGLIGGSGLRRYDRARCQLRSSRSSSWDRPARVCRCSQGHWARTAASVQRVRATPHGRGSRRTTCRTASRAAARATGGKSGFTPASGSDGQPGQALRAETLQPVHASTLLSGERTTGAVRAPPQFIVLLL
jgi:hypothetical protein